MNGTELNPLLESDIGTAIYIITILISVTMCLSYLLIIILIIRDSKLHTLSDYFIASMSITELLMGSVVLPLFINSFVELKPYRFTYLAVCWSITTGIWTSFFLNLVLIAADAYYKISRPFEYVRFLNNRKCAYAIVIIWMVSFVSFAVSLLVLQFSHSPHGKETIVELFGRHFVMYFIYLDVVMAPSIIIVAGFGVRLIRLARKQKRQIDNAAFVHVKVAVQKQKERKVTTTSIVYIAISVVCWFPVIVTWNIFYIFDIELSSRNLTTVLVCSSVILMHQTALGTLLFTIRQTKYKDALKNIIRTFKNTFTY